MRPFFKSHDTSRVHEKRRVVITIGEADENEDSPSARTTLRRRREAGRIPNPVIEYEILEGTVGAFAQSANFDKVGGKKCESGHLNLATMKSVRERKCL